MIGWLNYQGPYLSVCLCHSQNGGLDVLVDVLLI